MSEEINKKTLYEILGIAVDATKDEIKKAYKRMAAKTHPDRDGGDVEMFKEVQRAYATLSDEKLKARYDGGEDEGVHIPTNLEQAYQNLSVLFNSIIRDNIDAIEGIDIMASIKKSVEVNRREPTAAIKAMKHKLKKLATLEKKLSRKKKKKDSPDLFEHIIGMDRQQTEAIIARNNDQLEIMDMMEEMAAEYSYDFDPAEGPTSTNYDHNPYFPSPGGRYGQETAEEAFHRMRRRG